MSTILMSTVDQVSIYRQGAVVTRVATLERGEGAFPVVVRLEHLPASLEDTSVRVRVAAPDGVGAPVAIDVRIGLAPLQADDPVGSAHDEELDRLRGAERRCESRREAVLGEIAALRAMPVYRRRRGKRIPAPTVARLELLATRTARLAQLDHELRRLDEELRQARNERGRAESAAIRRRQQSAHRKHEVEKVLELELDVAGATAAVAEIRIEYTVPGARWVPTYTVRLGALLDTCLLELRAMICQSSGEDWKGARVLLATASLAGWTGLPELQSLRIGRAQPHVPRRGYRPLPSDLDELYADYHRAFPAERPRGDAGPLPPARPPANVAPMDDLDMDAGYGGSGPPTLTGFATAPGASPPVPGEPAMAQMAPRRVAPSASSAPVGESAQATGVRRRVVAPPPSPPPPPPMMMARAVTGKSIASFFAPAPAGRDSRDVTLTGAPGGGRESLMAMSGEEMELGDSLDAAGRPPPPPRTPEPPSFGLLRMSGPQNRGRGRLEPVTPVESYTSHLPSELRSEVAGALERTLSATAQVLSRRVPQGTRIPGTTGGYDYAYVSEHRFDVPSDGEFHTIVLLEQKLPAQLSHIAVPREATEVFRELSLSNPMDAPVLAGPADIVVDGQFLMTVPLSEVPPGGKLKLGMGVEPAIKVARNATFAERTIGLMGGRLELDHAFTIEVANLMGRPATVEVRERVPIPGDQDGRVKVVLGTVQPPWESFEQEEPVLKGGHRWRLELAPAGTARLSASYTVQIDSGDEVVDGNRREP